MSEMTLEQRVEAMEKVIAYLMITQPHLMPAAEPDPLFSEIPASTLNEIKDGIVFDNFAEAITADAEPVPVPEPEPVPTLASTSEVQS
jgi:hypothetical protein